MFAKVHAANIHDTKAGQYVIARAQQLYPTLIGVCADAGYRGSFAEFALLLGLKVDISERIATEWAIIPKRWRVERSFAWMNSYRRLSKDYEISALSEEAHVYIASIALLLRRLF